MDDERKGVLDFLSTTLDSEFEIKSIGDYIWEAEHYYDVKVSRNYNHYSVKDFITLYQIDCLFNKGLITENDRNSLIRLFYQKKDLFGRIGRRKEDDERLSDKIDLIDQVFAKYNIGNIDLASMVYNNAIIKENTNLQEEIVRMKI